MVTTREVVLCHRPRGRIEPECFTLAERELPAGSAGQLLVRADCISVDPSMIPRLSAVDYQAGHLAGQLRAVALDGIDVYFDNVGGDHLEAALDLLRIGGRAAICGMISGYGQPSRPGPGNLTQLVVRRLRLEGFLVLDHLRRRPVFEEEVRPLVESGVLRSEVTVFDGLASAPQALLPLPDGAKLGKALVRP